MSIGQNIESSPTTNHKQHLHSLKDRLEKYKLKNEIVTQREIEIEAQLAEKQKLEKEREAIRLETEKQALILELQRVSKAKPPAPPAPPAQPVQQAPPPSFFNTGAMSFGYPGMVTEKEAIDWLRNGF